MGSTLRLHLSPCFHTAAKMGCISMESAIAYE